MNWFDIYLEREYFFWMTVNAEVFVDNICFPKFDFAWWCAKKIDKRKSHLFVTKFCLSSNNFYSLALFSWERCNELQNWAFRYVFWTISDTQQIHWKGKIKYVKFTIFRDIIFKLIHLIQITMSKSQFLTQPIKVFLAFLISTSACAKFLFH